MKWYLQNAARRIQYALQNPRYAMRTAFRELTFADERFIATATGTHTRPVRGFLQEPFVSTEFLSHMRESQGDFDKGMSSADLWAKKVLIQYAAVRALQPKVVVETGVASGVSSAYILLAMKRNQKGILHSVEIGDTSYLPAGKEPGWIVPQWLRPRWHLHIGDVAAVTPGLLRGIGPSRYIHS